MSINGNTVDTNPTLNGKLTQLPTIDTTLSISGNSADAKVTGDALRRKVNYTDIVDNCTTEADNKPLSAKQGVLLQRQIEELKARLNG